MDDDQLQGPRDPHDRVMSWCEAAETMQGPELCWLWELQRIALEGGWDLETVWLQDCRQRWAARQFRRMYGRAWTDAEFLAWVGQESGEPLIEIVTDWVLLEAGERER